MQKGDIFITFAKVEKSRSSRLWLLNVHVCFAVHERVFMQMCIENIFQMFDIMLQGAMWNIKLCIVLWVVNGWRYVVGSQADASYVEVSQLIYPQGLLTLAWISSMIPSQQCRGCLHLENRKHTMNYLESNLMDFDNTNADTGKWTYIYIEVEYIICK